MTQRKTIYYLAFPAFIFLLCMFSYQLGYKRALSHTKQEQISKVLDELDKNENETSKLTYYQDLHSDKNPIVEQVNANKNEKKAPPITVKPTTTDKGTLTTVTMISPAQTTTNPAPSTEKQSMAIQVGAFTDLGKADELTDRLKNAGFEAYTKPIQSKGNELFRVLVRSSKNEIPNVQAKLDSQGFKGTFAVTK